MSGAEGPRITGTLRRGVLVDGVRHKDFELRLAVVADNVDAIDEVGGHNGVALNAAVLARQLTRLGTLDHKQINYDLLAGMGIADYNQLDAAATALEKKLWAELEAEETSSSAPDSPLSVPG